MTTNHNKKQTSSTSDARRNIIVICSDFTQARLIEYVARPASVVQIDGKLCMSTLCEAIQKAKFDGAIIHLPCQIGKAVELQTFIRAVHYHSRVRILPTTYGGRHLLSPSWKTIVRFVARASEGKVK